MSARTITTSAATSFRLHSTTMNGQYNGSIDSNDIQQQQQQLWYPPSLMEHMLHRIQEINNVPYQIQQSLINFTVNSRILGKVTPKVAAKLTSPNLPTIFELSTGTNTPTLTLSNAAGTTVEQRTKSVMKVMELLREEGYVTGWRDELYPVAERFDDAPVFLIERAAASLLGVMEYGVHINGIIEGPQPKMWMARRSSLKSKFPGYLDHIVAGGQPYNLSLLQNVLKECDEEAGIPPELTLQGIKPAGVISYEQYGGSAISKSRGEGVLGRVVLFCYDLILPEDFVPVPKDGEVECFFTWGLEEIGKSMDPEFDDPIKPNCYPVIIDYLIRSGAISPDSPKYLDIVRTLRSGTCS